MNSSVASLTCPCREEILICTGRLLSLLTALLGHTYGRQSAEIVVLHRLLFNTPNLTALPFEYIQKYTYFPLSPGWRWFMTAVLHLDVDAFFASVEQRDDPQLRGRPVAVGAGVVASCSYEARRFGVRTGMRLLDARRLCSQLSVLPGEYPRYEQAARCIVAVCQDYTPRVEVAALDDLYLALTPDDGPDRRAGILREQIRDEV